jgi:hypothetical protein
MELPFEITEAMVQCFGRCFHYKDRMEAFLRAAGVSPGLAGKYRTEYKFVWAKIRPIEIHYGVRMILFLANR